MFIAAVYCRLFLFIFCLLIFIAVYFLFIAVYCCLFAVSHLRGEDAHGALAGPAAHQPLGRVQGGHGVRARLLRLHVRAHHLLVRNHLVAQHLVGDTTQRVGELRS